MKRIATALVLIPVVVWVTIAAPYAIFVIVLALVGLLAYHEFHQVAVAQGVAKAGWTNTALGMAAGLALLFGTDTFLTIVAVALVGMTLALRLDDLTGALPGASVFVLGVVYIFGAWRCASLLREINPHWLMIALLVSWAGDTAAMYTGKAFGKHKLAPVVSPGKTWEGAVGSVIGAAIAAGIYAHYLIRDEPMINVLVLAAAANIAGQVGDLCESAFKRGANLKDSGTMLPGHGGWLDRIDSTLFTVPVVYMARIYIMGRVI